MPDGTLWKDSLVKQAHAVYDIARARGTYRYKVRAYNAHGTGSWSAVKTFTVTG
jgi:hypothetical protein